MSFPIEFILSCISFPAHTERPHLYHQTVKNFCLAVHVFFNLFETICALFEQILSTCLKFFWASFCPSSYRKNIRWGQGCWISILCCTIPLIHFIISNNCAWDIRDCKSDGLCSFVLVSLLFLRFSCLHFLREQ